MSTSRSIVFDLSNRKPAHLIICVGKGYIPCMQYSCPYPSRAAACVWEPLVIPQMV